MNYAHRSTFISTEVFSIQTMFQHSPPHKMVVAIEARLSASEMREHSHDKFPPLYQLLVQATGELVVASFFGSLQVNNQTAQVAELCWWFVAIGFVPNNGTPSIS